MRGKFRLNRECLQKGLETLNKFGYTDNGISRLAYTEAEQRAVEFLITSFENEGMDVTVDGVGNVIARREGADPTLPAVACGSHIDTVYHAGKYDGTVGVIAGLEMIRYLNEKQIETKHPIEVIVFACEESARFGVATIGSKLMTGIYEKDVLQSFTDKTGMTILDALNQCEIDTKKQVHRKSSELKVFYELHIEQGPVLEKVNKQIGIVTGIAAPTRFRLNIHGQAAHSGSTPMSDRKDAFLGAAEIALALEEAAYREMDYGTVATVGTCEIKDGAMNVVPGKTEMLIDIRSISMQSKERVVEQFVQAVKAVETKRNLIVHMNKLCDELPVVMDKDVIQSIKNSCEHHGFTYVEMASGAGQDRKSVV